MRLPAWVRGPYELIEHAEGHYHGTSDTDRRIALIGFDNAIEVIITTYLQLNPKLRGGVVVRKDEAQKWLQNYHTKIEFFEDFITTNNIAIESSTSEIIWYHTLRNELYHSGNGMVPERYCIDGARDAAIEVFKVLFGVDVGSLLSASRAIVARAEHDKGVATIQNKFLQSYIAFERALRSSALAIGAKIVDRPEGTTKLWDVFRAHSGKVANAYDSVVENARQIRNQFVHTGITDCSDQELEQLIEQLDKLIVFLQSFGFSFDILPTLNDRYGDWVRPNISIVRIIHKNGSAYLEVTSRTSGVIDEESKRVDLNFITVGDEVSGDEPLFSSTRRAQENADRFFDELDLYSIVMTGIGDVLFTSEGIEAAAKLSGADVGKPRGEITRRQ